MNESLSQKPIEKSAYYSVFKMKLDNIFIQRPGVLKHDGTDRRVLPPFP